MTYDNRYVPSLFLDTTISHPIEDVRVIGFSGRDKTYGRDAVVLKAEAIATKAVEATDRYPVAYTLYGVPDEQVERVKNGHALYIVDDETVYATQDIPDVAERESFSTEYGDTYYMGIPSPEPTEYYRKAVDGV